MAGLNNLISNTAQQTTTLPSWFDTAQQNVVSQAGQTFANAPSPQQTVAQNAVNQLSGPSNAFNQAAGTLQSIASGAANPWIVTPQYASQPISSGGFPTQPNWGAMRTVDQGTPDDFGGISSLDTGGGFPTLQRYAQMTGQEAPDGISSLDTGGGFPTLQRYAQMTGQEAPDGISSLDTGGGMPIAASQPQAQPTGYNVAPNPYTALGGLFAAQNQQLNQLLPNVTAPVEGGNIAAGNFGSLRGQTAVNKAKADAFAQLAAAQNQAALQNQATGVNAAQGVGNLTQQEINNLLTVGQYQQASPFSNVSNYGKILGSIQAPTTVSNQTQLSPLNQVGGLIAALGGTGAGTGILNSLGVGGLTGLFNSLSNYFSGPSGSYIPNSNPALDNRDVGLGENTDPNYVAPVAGSETI